VNEARLRFVYSSKLTKKIIMKHLLALISIALILNCTKTEQIEIVKEFDGPVINKAVSVVHPIGDNSVTGIVNFERTDEGTKVDVQVTGLTEGQHGFHIHQYGDCTAPDGTSAGGHFNPDDMNHSSRESEKRHMGDMGNLMSEGENQTATLSYIDKTIYLEQILGRGIIIHAGEDDLTSQPSGAAGARIACGVIGISKDS